VGALVLDRAATLVAEAGHHGPGTEHAEAAALRQAGGRARGGTLIVTLEPCDHFGRTPPCTDAIIESGVVRVVFGAGDPDMQVDGRGAARLDAAGIEVIAGVLAAEAEAMDPSYFHQRRTGRPFVTLKTAMTLDGQVAAADGTSQWITGLEARADAHRLRGGSDVVLVGAGTVIADDPRLTVRLPSYAGHQPLPVVIAGTRALPADAAIFSRKAIVYSPIPAELPAEVVEVPGEGGVDLAAVLADLGERRFLDVLVEGGPTVARALLDAGFVDRGVAYVGGLIAGGAGRPAFSGTFPSMDAARPARIEDVQQLGPDLRVDFSIGGR
jgi:diaminohydroxyphosphoribosylaminopyrimidine deaminase/5-amino-6-(5-phosphoribosylamino)uracil reductase